MINKNFLSSYSYRIKKGKNILNFNNYNTEGFYDEYFENNTTPRLLAQEVIKKLNHLENGELLRRQHSAEKSLFEMGITFNVYGDKNGREKIFPFDIIPRLVSATEWEQVEKGLKQRIRALNFFLDDIYNDQKIIKDKIIDPEIILSASAYRKECQGLHPPKGIWCHITGTDLVRGSDGQFYVLEDNLRCPSGISYVIENRAVIKRTFPQLFEKLKVLSVDKYPSELLAMLQFLSPKTIETPTVVVLTPGVFNSAYFEHSFLAQQMGIELVEGRDLLVKDNFVYMRTTKGLKRVDVIYRRIDDDFLDPKVFRPDSVLGIPGIMDVYRKGNVSLANTPGNGVADDKAVYTYVPDIIKYYLNEEAILPNVPTYKCANPQDFKYVIENIANLVVKAVDESGGYGMIIGPHASEKEISLFKDKIKTNPRKYIAQPVITLSRVPTIIEKEFKGRHVDLRPYIICGEDIYITPGGLTRVALPEGSLIVNSSQGGGSKDTWVVSD